jgi:hypothetical protein
MGQYLTAKQLRRDFSEPLFELAADFRLLCQRWDGAIRAGDVARPDLLLNDSTAAAGLASLRKLHEEASAKLDDAIAGVYRYRDSEHRRRQGGGTSKPQR